MGKSSLVIHCNARVKWQAKRVQLFAAGLAAKGIDYEITDSFARLDDRPAILLGTTFWRDVEATGEYLLVDRCSYGDTDVFTSLVWNGHGGRGDHRIPENYDASRWEKFHVELMPWKHGTKRVVCGQTESYSDRNLGDWYRSVGATHFRKHPAGDNPAGLPEWNSFHDCELITLNSSVAIQGMIQGVKTEVHDIGGMAFGTECTDEGRLALMHRLAWTQWSDEEIKQGSPIGHLFEQV
jgi:hypothetical protein